MLKATVIFTTYNSPDWLEKVIWGFACQTVKPHELIVADDGSDETTRQRIAQLKEQTRLNLIHVWHPDNGFQKTLILNKAIQASSGNYLIFTDGDCIPRADFVATHVSNAEKGYFLSGGYFKLPMETSQAITKDDILEQRCFNVAWLLKHGLKRTYKTAKLTTLSWQQSLFNALTPAGATWNGHNASGWKSDLVAANGFDQRMQYGGEDRELGERLFNAGVKSKQMRYSAAVIHLDHSRGYVTAEARQFNNSVRAATRKNKATRTEHGIEQLQELPVQ